MTIAAAVTRGATSSTSVTINKAAVAATQAKVNSTVATASATVTPAAVVDLSASARAQLAKLVAASPSATTETDTATGPGLIKSFDESVQDRTSKLATDLNGRLTKLGVPLDEPIKLQLDSIGQVTTDSPYKKKIEKMFQDDPELAKEFKDVASLNGMRAAQKALEAFDAEKKAAKNDDEKSLAYGRYTSRLIESQDLSGTMTLDDGKLRSASVEFMSKSVGEIIPAEASTKAKQAVAQQISRMI